MSQHPHSSDSHGHGAHHDAHHGHEATPGIHFSLRGYLTGFFLSAVLTAIPFWLVMGKVLPSATVTGVVLIAFAVAQILVHMVYFLHLDARSEGGWNLISILFTLILLVIVLAGTLWVMHHMNTNMMPMTPHDARMVD